MKKNQAIQDLIGTPNEQPKEYLGNKLVNPITKKDENMLDLLEKTGFTPDLQDITLEFIAKFAKNKEGAALTDEQFTDFYEYYRKELGANLITFLTLASKELLSPERLQDAKLKEIAIAIKNVSDIVKFLTGKATTEQNTQINTFITLPSDLQEARQMLKDKRTHLNSLNLDLLTDDRADDDTIDVEVDESIKF